MRRIFAIAAMLALAVPTVAAAQPNKGKGHPPPKGHPVGHGPVAHGRPVVRGPMVHGPVVHGPVAHGRPVVRGPVGHPPAHVVAGHAPWVFHGHPYAWHPIPYPHPWVYPSGYAYRLWAVGAILPPLFWSTPTYYYTGWAAMGLPPPDPGFQYIEYGPDLLLVNVSTGAVVQVFPGAFS
jgi:Ni/Co efflux regulator RcnB